MNYLLLENYANNIVLNINKNLESIKNSIHNKNFTLDLLRTNILFESYNAIENSTTSPKWISIISETARDNIFEAFIEARDETISRKLQENDSDFFFLNFNNYNQINFRIKVYKKNEYDFPIEYIISELNNRFSDINNIVFVNQFIKDAQKLLKTIKLYNPENKKKLQERIYFRDINQENMDLYNLENDIQFDFKTILSEKNILEDKINNKNNKYLFLNS